MGNCATGPKKSKSGDEAEAPIPPPEGAAAVTEKQETTTRDVDLTAVEPKVEPEAAKGEDVSSPAVVGLAVVATETAAVVVEGGEEEVVEKVKQVVLDGESTAEDAAGDKRFSLSKLFNKEQKVKTPEESDKTSSEPTKEVESSKTELVIKESESVSKVEVAVESVSKVEVAVESVESVSKVEVAVESVAVPEATPEPKLETPLVVIEKVIEVAEKSTEKQEKKPEEEIKA